METIGPKTTTTSSSEKYIIRQGKQNTKRILMKVEKERPPRLGTMVIDPNRNKNLAKEDMKKAT